MTSAELVVMSLTELALVSQEVSLYVQSGVKADDLKLEGPVGRLLDAMSKSLRILDTMAKPEEVQS